MTAEQDILIIEEPQTPLEQDEDAIIKKKIKWLPLEANPDVWNKIIHNNGVDPGWSFTDVYGFDAESLAMIPQPVAAIIFLFPITDAYEEFREKRKRI
ncbi:unnamed protein product [Mucor circinelloides]